VQVVSAAFPFKPALEALDGALAGSGGIPRGLAHLLALVLAYGVLARLALRRFDLR
jgi:hypothetical protein